MHLDTPPVVYSYSGKCILCALSCEWNSGHFVARKGQALAHLLLRHIIMLQSTMVSYHNVSVGIAIEGIYSSTFLIHFI